MRALIAILLIAALAVVTALLLKTGSGYVLIAAPPYRVEIALAAFVFFLIVGFAVIYGVVRSAVRLSQLPAEVRESRRRDQLERARNKQDAAVVALIEGRAGKAREFAQEALALPRSSPISALVGARAALETRDYATVDKLLAAPEAQATNLAVPRLMLEAEQALERGQANETLRKLAELKKEAGLHTAALRLELRALTAAGRHADIPPLVDQLVKRKVYDATQADLLRASAHAETLAGMSHDATGLREYWNRVPEFDRLQPKVARAAARSFLALGGDREAADILARSLERQWDADSALVFADCRTADLKRQIETAERWLAPHNDDPQLLFALGRLCEREQLWGKAQSYYEASLALSDNWRTRIALGELLGQLGRHEDANAHLAAALKLAVAELERAPSA